MQNIVEKMIKLTDLEDSIIEDSYDDDTYEENLDLMEMHNDEMKNTLETDLNADEIISAGV